MEYRRIIEDLSFNRFVKEVTEFIKEHPNAKLVGTSAGDDKRAENNFMFTAVYEYQ